MRIIRIVALLGTVLGLSACVGGEVSRNAPLDGPRLATKAPPLAVREVNVAVPRSLQVSEGNAYIPNADIVWRGEPFGDRHQQVANIFGDAMNLGLRDFDRGRPVELDITVTRFHSLTERARYTTGGWHSMSFLLAVRDAETGAYVMPPHEVQATINAYGGARALKAEREGITQRVRIVDHLAKTIRRELLASGT